MLKIITGGGLKQVEDDITPVLGGDLDGGGYDISNVGTGTFEVVNATDEDNALKIDGTTILKTGPISENNLFIGNNVGKTDNAGESNKNVGIGYDSINSLTTGDENVAVGSQALQNVTTGILNVGLGSKAGNAITTGNSNMCIGASSGMSTSGGDNLFIGYVAGQRLAGPSRSNVGLGSFSLKGAVSSYASYNIAIGYASLLVVSNAEKNTSIGNESGRLLTTGDSNVFIGNSAGRRQTTNSDLLIIDNQDRASAANEATKALIYGVFAAVAADQDLTLNANVFLTQVKSGSDQANAGAVANEVWKTNGHATLPDNVLMIGV